MSETIFISYRRSEAAMVAGRLRQSLEHQGEKVFRDLDSIRGGEDFTKAVEEALGTGKVTVLALMGPSWAKTPDEAGIPRLNNPADWNRVELELAIRRGARIIPLLIHDAQMPSDSELPERRRPIVKRNFRRLRDADWDPDIMQILNDIRPRAPVHSSAQLQGDRLSSFIQNSPHPAYIFNKVRFGNKEDFRVVECNGKINELLDLDAMGATEPEMQKASREIVHPLYREHWDLMQSYYRWQVINCNRTALHHSTFLKKSGHVWSTDIYAVNLGPGGYLCLVLLEEATPAEKKLLNSGQFMPKHQISDDSEYYKSKDYAAYTKALRR